MSEVKLISYPHYLKSDRGNYFRITSDWMYSVITVKIRPQSQYYSFMKCEALQAQVENIINDMDFAECSEEEYMKQLKAYTDYAAKLSQHLKIVETPKQPTA